jgi:hypothetical protein
VARKSVGDVRFPAGWIVVVEGPGRGAYFAVTNSVSSIGRGLDQSICLNFGDASISRNNHAAIAYDAEQNRFFLGHGNKSNIVRRNGQPVLSTEELMRRRRDPHRQDDAAVRRALRRRLHLGCRSRGGEPDAD